MAKEQVTRVLFIVGGIMLALALAKGAVSTFQFSPEDLQNTASATCDGNSSYNSGDCEYLFYTSALVIDVLLPVLCGGGGLILLLAGAIMSPGGSSPQISEPMERDQSSEISDVHCN